MPDLTRRPDPRLPPAPVLQVHMPWGRAGLGAEDTDKSFITRSMVRLEADIWGVTNLLPREVRALKFTLEVTPVLPSWAQSPTGTQRYEGSYLRKVH